MTFRETAAGESPPTTGKPEASEAVAQAGPPPSWRFDEDDSWSSATTTEPESPTPAPPVPPSSTEPEPSPAAGPAAREPAGTGPLTAGAHAVVAHPARMVLGMASLAAQRLRGGVPPGDAFATGVGLLQETATSLRDFGRRVIEPASRLAADTVDRAVDRASGLPGTAIPVRSMAISRARLAKVVARARRRGEATVAAGRADARAFVQSSVAETINWAQAQAVPQIVDGLVPHLVDEVVPRILEGALPEIRAKLLPVVIDDLAESPQLRELMLEQGRGVVGDAAEHLRTTTATADDRVESAFRRLVRAEREDPTDHVGRTTSEPSTPPVEGG